MPAGGKPIFNAEGAENAEWNVEQENKEIGLEVEDSRSVQRNDDPLRPCYYFACGVRSEALQCNSFRAFPLVRPGLFCVPLLAALSQQCFLHWHRDKALLIRSGSAVAPGVASHLNTRNCSPV